MSVCATQKSSSLTFNSIFDILRCIPKHNSFLIISETGCFYIILVALLPNERYLYLREHHSHFSKKFSFQNCPYSCLMGTPLHVLIDHVEVERNHQKYKPRTTNTYFISTLCDIFNNGSSNLIALVNLYVRL